MNQGRIQGFPKGGLRPAIRNAGGGGGASTSGPIQKAGKGEGLFSRRGGVTIYERGGCNPQTPGSASVNSVGMLYQIRLPCKRLTYR